MAPAAIRIPMPCTPAALFERLAGEPWAFWLDSAQEDPRLGRYAYLGSRPFLVFSARGRRWTIREGARLTRGTGDPFRKLRDLVVTHRLPTPPGAPPCLAGAVGWVGYEAGRLLERIPGARPPGDGLPDLAFAFFESIAAFDLPRGEVWVAGGGLTGPKGSLAARQAARGAALLDLMRSAEPPLPREPFRLLEPPTSDLGPGAHAEAVESIRDSIARGEIYQANLTRRLTARCAGDPVDLYRRLRTASAAPFAAFLRSGDTVICSASPERFFRVAGRRIETRPIKGTRPRDADPALDRAAALDLVRSAKDHAEHMMIVDLERNDLGRICEPGSVHVPELAALEMFPQVFHLTSTVEGRLRRGATAVDALRELFPGGSITGAPKIAAERVLASLEPGPRGPYTGALGWFSFGGHADCAIAIRTAVVRRGRLTWGTGGGIVADSEPAAEWAETEAKTRGLLAALGGADPAGARVRAGSIRR